MELTGKAKYEDVVHRLRSDIVKGVYSPGNRLPNRSDIGQQFGVGMATVQKALDMLTEDGFIRARAGAGTFVVDNPPHLSDYALIIPAASLWSRCYSTLRAAATIVADGEKVKFKEYNPSRDIGNRSEIIRLSSDVVNHRLAGIIVAGFADELVGTPAIEMPGIPRVLHQPMPGFDYPVVCLDGFLDKATEYLKSRGRKRVAHLCLDFAWTEIDAFIQQLKQRLDDVRNYWVQPLRIGERFHGTKHVVDLLMQLEGDKRPDSLIIHDDNLVDQAVAGLLAGGIKVPDEIEVVAMANFPSFQQSALPIKRIGYDFRQVLEKSLEIMQMERSGQTPPRLTKLTATYEEDVDYGPAYAGPDELEMRGIILSGPKTGE